MLHNVSKIDIIPYLMALLQIIIRSGQNMRIANYLDYEYIHRMSLKFNNDKPCMREFLFFDQRPESHCIF